MIYVFGDLHGDLRNLSIKHFENPKDMTRDDYAIVAGDFGGVWDDSPRENYWLDWLEALPFTTLFVDGNHENFAMLNALPVKEWHGGKVHAVRPHILHLMRGQVFQLDDMTFFTMGGAASHDIEDGILELTDPDYERKLRNLLMTGGRFRVLGMSWWPEEMPNDEEYAEAERNLERVGWNVDCIVTHCAPTSIALKMDRHNEPDRLTDFLQTVRQRCEYDYWFLGHYHRDVTIDKKHFVQYRHITMIEPQESDT